MDPMNCIFAETHQYQTFMDLFFALVCVDSPYDILLARYEQMDCFLIPSFKHLIAIGLDNCI
jgi:hypothetical protein